MRALLLCLVAGFALQCYGQGTSFSFASYTYPTTEKSFFRLGDKVMTLAKHGDESDKPYIMVSLHHNETTSIAEAKDFVVYNGGVFYELLNNNQRNVSFELLDKKVVFDPNRIFTGWGRTENLKLNKSWNKVADKQLLNFARFILNELPESKTIVAVHNNTDGNYSINSYKKGGELEKDAKEVYHNTTMDADDFFLTTSKTLYDKLKQQECNVVLQSNKAKDDGSLSIYCAKAFRDYVNVETQHGHTSELKNMLKILEEVLN